MLNIKLLNNILNPGISKDEVRWVWADASAIYINTAHIKQ